MIKMVRMHDWAGHLLICLVEVADASMRLA